MRYKKVIKGANGIDYEISSDVDCLDTISVNSEYIEHISGFSIGTLYEIGSVTVKEIPSDRHIIIKEDKAPKGMSESYFHIMQKQRKKRTY